MEVGGIAHPRTRLLGSRGPEVSPVGLDGAVFGWSGGASDTARTLSAFLDGGGSLVSTADHYAAGRSEHLIGAWLRTVPDRDRVVIATKVGRHPDHYGLDSQTILAAVDESLARLQTDHIDVLSFDLGEGAALGEQAPLEDRLDAAERLVRLGKVRSLGATGEDLARVRALERDAGVTGPGQLDALLVEYNLVRRGKLEGLLPIVHDAEVGVLARLPLAQGFLTGRYAERSEVPPTGVFAGAAEHFTRRGTRVLALVEQIAHELGATPAAVAMAWVLSRPAVTSAIVRARNEEELLAVQGSAELRLSRHQLVRLDAASD